MSFTEEIHGDSEGLPFDTAFVLLQSGLFVAREAWDGEYFISRDEDSFYRHPVKDPDDYVELDEFQAADIAAEDWFEVTDS